MPEAVVLQRDEREVHVWLSKEQRVEVIETSDCPDGISVGSLLELKIDARCRVEECKVIDRPLKMKTAANGMTMFLDIFIFPQRNLAFSIYFGAIPVDSQFDPLPSDRSHVVYATWDERRSEMIILKQSPPRSRAPTAPETIEINEAYEKYLPLRDEGTTAHEETPKKEKITVAISPMGREEERSTSDRISTISTKMESVSIMDAKRMNDGYSSVRSTGNARMALPNMRNHDSMQEKKESMPSRSGYSKEGSGIASHSGGYGRKNVEEEIECVDGIVTGEHQSPSGVNKKFFVWTMKGSVTVYPRVHQNVRPAVRVGDYVRVEMRSRDGSHEVEDISVTHSKPSGHKMAINDGTVLITCDVKYIKRVNDDYKAWWIAESTFLGLIGVEAERGGPDMVGRKGSITVKNLKAGVSIVLEKAKVGWIAMKAAPIKKSASKPVNGWYTGIVTAVMEDAVYVASPQLKEDALLYLNETPEDAMGKWITFQLQRMPEDPPEINRINSLTFRKIPDVFETRHISGFPEIRVSLSYGGDEDEGRPMLTSEMGAVRDCDGLVNNDRDGHGYYNAWIVRYRKSNHISRWRFSRIDAKVERSMEPGEARRVASRSPSPNSMKHQAIEEDRMREERRLREERARRMERAREEEKSGYEEGELELRDIMRRVILENEEIRLALINADRIAYNEMFEILID
ncbi:hypothetical protein PENTCL1PPCAC_18218 [Pristionchus entomophagus]|uniref:Uncharacterized protein n=1 Tax=Pristionchus entomophagus TaxID=358040 RepID=A0AAV5TNP5_9BILA|nr:hypothetical protein PENTCL1PPCAC_18218 [Pristionchus entomophagus]